MDFATGASLALGGASVLGGMFGKKKGGELAWWGNTNIDDYHLPGMQWLMSGTGTGGEFFGNPINYKDPITGLNKVRYELPEWSKGGIQRVLGKQIGRDTSRVKGLTEFSQNTLGHLEKTFRDSQKSVNSRVGGNSNELKGMAGSISRDVMGYLDGSYDDAKQTYTRDMEKTFRDIDRATGARAAQSGLKTSRQNVRSGTQKKDAANAIFDALAMLQVREGETKAQTAGQLGQMELGTAMSRASQEEAMASDWKRLGLDNLQKSRSQYLGEQTSLMELLRGYETAPFDKLMQYMSAAPTASAQSAPQPDFMSRLSGSLGGLSNLAGSYAGYSAANKQNANINDYLGRTSQDAFNMYDFYRASQGIKF